MGDRSIAGADRSDDENDDRAFSGDRSLAALVRAGIERGENTERIVERVRASYDRDLRRRRVRRLVDEERARLEAIEPPSIDEHAPRYAALADLASLTDREFARVIAHLLGTIEGRATVDTGTHEPEKADEPAREANDERDPRTDDSDAPPPGSELDRVPELPGVGIRWERPDRTVRIRALADEPERVLDGSTVDRMGKSEFDILRATPRDESNGGKRSNGKEVSEPPVTKRIVTVAPVTPGAARLAIRVGIGIDDRSDVARWLERTRLPIAAFGSLLEAD